MIWYWRRKNNKRKHNPVTHQGSILTVTNVDYYVGPKTFPLGILHLEYFFTCDYEGTITFVWYLCDICSYIYGLWDFFWNQLWLWSKIALLWSHLNDICWVSMVNFRSKVTKLTYQLSKIMRMYRVQKVSGLGKKYRVSRKSIGLIYIGFFFFPKIVSG